MIEVEDTLKNMLEDIRLVDLIADFDEGVYKVECRIGNDNVIFTALFDEPFNLENFKCGTNKSDFVGRYKHKILEFIRLVVIKQCWEMLREKDYSTIFQCSNVDSKNEFDFEALIVDFERPVIKHFCSILDKLMPNFYTRGSMCLLRRIQDHVIKGNVDFLVRTEDIVDSFKIHEGWAKEKTNQGAGMLVWNVEKIELKRL